MLVVVVMLLVLLNAAVPDKLEVGQRSALLLVVVAF